METRRLANVLWRLQNGRLLGVESLCLIKTSTCTPEAVLLA